MDNNIEKSSLKSAILEFKKKNLKITKDKNNPFYKSKYADLANILEVIDEHLAEVGLIITSYPTFLDGVGWVLATELYHKNDENYLRATFPIIGNKPQEQGSSITYARRYNIQSLLNLAADDDDGNGANDAQSIKSSPATPQKKSEKTEEEKLKKAKEWSNNYLTSISNCKNLDELADIQKKNKIALDKLNNIYPDIAGEISITSVKIFNELRNNENIKNEEKNDENCN